MDQVTKVKKHLKREQWKRLIQDCQSSGLPVAVWCRQNSICEQTAGVVKLGIYLVHKKK